MNQPQTTPEETTPSFRWVAIVFLILAEIMMFSPALIHNLVGDDHAIRGLHETPVASLWSSDSTALPHWRPISATISHIVFSLIGESSFLWHALNILIHLGTVFLFFQILSAFARSSKGDGLIGITLAAVVFQIHPAAIQTVYKASGLSDLLCMFFLIASTYAAVRTDEKGARHRVVISSGLFAFALLSNEAAIGFPIFLLLLFILMDDSLSSIIHHRGVLLCVDVAMSIAALAMFPSGRIITESTGGSLLHAVEMLIVPADSPTIVEATSLFPWITIVVLLVFVLAAFILVREKLIRIPVLLLAVLALIIGLAAHADGRGVSQRSMYYPVGFTLLSVYWVLTRKEWWKEWNLTSRVLRGVIALFTVAVLATSVSSVLDWHVADKYGKAIRASFSDFHLLAQEKQYLFGALPSKLRQAEIVGDAEGDFRGQLRKDEIADTVEMKTLLRIVLNGRDEPSTNVLIIRTSERTLVIQTQTDNQYFLPGSSGIVELPIGTAFKEDLYSIEVLEADDHNRATAVMVTVEDSAELEKLLFYDDMEKQFVPYQGLEVGIDEKTDEEGS